MMRTKIIHLLAVSCACLLLSGCPDSSEYKLQGYIEAEFTYIATHVAGKLIALDVTRGQQVAVGDALFELEALPERADVSRSQAQLESAQENLANLLQGERTTVLEGIMAQLQQAQAQLELARLSLERNQELFKTKVVAKAALDDAQANHQAALKKVDEIKARLAEAQMGARKHILLAQTATVSAEKANVERQQWLLQQKNQTATVAGQVYDTFYRVGEYVPAGQPLLALLTPDNIKLIFYLPEPQLSRYHVGDTVHFTCDSCQGSTSANIAYIAPRAEYTPPILYTENTRKNLVYRVEAHIKPEEAKAFKAGQPVDVHLSAPKEK